MYDVIIIGGGPGGMTAALYSLRAGRKTMIFEEKMFGGQMAETPVIENMPGSPDAEGWKLSMAFSEQVEKLGPDICYERVTKLSPWEGYTQVCTDKNCYQARKVILAMGVRRNKLGVPGEEEFSGRGVGWCAVCDGAFYRGKTVAVVGGGNTALEDALYLAGICEKVYLVVRRDSFRGAQVLKERVTAQENIEVLFEATVKEIRGDSKVTGITLEQQGQEKELELSGVFEAIGLSPDKGLYEGIVETDSDGYIIAGEDCRTSVPGMFAVGDVRTKEIRQIVTAIADGAVAAELSGRELQVEGERLRIADAG